MEPSPAAPSDPKLLNASALITLATVDPDNGGLLVGGYVSGVTEDGGDCQYIVTSAKANPLTIHKDGVENNGSTSCGSTTIPKDLVPSGTYTVILKYLNNVGQVVSPPVTVDLP